MPKYGIKVYALKVSTWVVTHGDRTSKLTLGNSTLSMYIGRRIRG